MPHVETGTSTRAVEQTEEIVQIGWYCWRCKGLVDVPCRSDNVPLYAPHEWENEMLNEIRAHTEEGSVKRPPRPATTPTRPEHEDPA